MAQEAEGASTPLQQRLDRLGKRMAVIVIITAAVVAGIGVLAGQPMILMIETAIALGVAAIPEGLPIVATIALARGMWLMARRNALINHLPAVETLGATTVIFTDKTGTLTENRMTAGRIVTSAGEFGGADAATAEEGNEVKDALDAGQQAADDALARRLLEVAVLCNKASLHQAEDRAATGDPMEIALLEAGEHAGLSRPELLERKEEVREEPFSRDVMMMATYHQTEDGLLVAVKGAPAAVLEACDRVAARGGEAEPLTDEAREQWSSNVQALAKRGLRLLAFADKQAGSTEDAPYDNLRLLGLVGLLDPPREDVRDAINLCQAAGVQVVMVTGDQPETAGAIAEAVGIVGDPGDPAARVMHGKDLRDPGSLNDEEKREVHASNIFARVTPEQKLNLIELYQERSEVVAMTGDGVNDAPALKKADIGVAMGQRGTEAAKQVADMVLKDDAFQSIVAAVEQGRVIFGNIRKSVMFMLCTNGAEVLAVAIASLAALPLPLRPLQILYLNVLTDVLPALALGVGTGSGKEMDRPPRPKSQSILTRRHWSAIGGSSALLGATVLAGLLLGMHWLGLQEFSAVTCSFLVLAFGKLWFVFNLRDPDAGALSNDVTRNPWIWGSIVVCAGLLLAAVYVPGLSDVLKTRAIGGEAWGLVLTLSLVPLVLGQLALAIYNLRRGRARRAATRQRERAAAAEA
jgi:Ca2+-transporting ATPase